MINPGLTLLIRLNLRGLARAAWRRLRTVKGAVAALVLTPLILLVVGSQLYFAVLDPDAAALRPDAAATHTFVPAFALLMILSEAWTGRALAFKPQELDFLFPAPVSRRELLGYHLLSRLPLRVMSALWLSVFTLRVAHHPLAALLTPLLLFVFIHVATELIALAGAASAAWAGPWRSRALWATLAGVALWSAARAIRAGGGAVAGLDAALRAPALGVLTLPVRPFAYMYAAAEPGGVLVWAGVALAEIAALTGLVLGLDVAYNERAMAASRRALERMRLAGAGQARGVARPWKLRVRVPMPRPLGGAAPIAWRQTLELIRNPRALFLPLVLPGLYVVLFLAIPALDGTPITRGFVIGAVAVSVLVPLLLPNVGFDFRRDMDRIAMLRALPIRPAAVARGQIFAPTMAFLAAQVAVVAAVAAASPVVSARWVLAAVAIGAPLTWTVVALDNLLFLWMPYRFSNDGAQNVQFAGKTMLILAAKMLVLAMVGGLAALAGWGAMRVSAQPALAVAAAAAVLVLGCVPITWAAGAAFQGFDLATDLPN